MKEQQETIQEWFDRLAEPLLERINDRTGQNLDLPAFIAQMYDNSVRGDWDEFGDKARDLGWVQHVVEHVEEDGLLYDPTHGENPNYGYEWMPFFEAQMTEDGKHMRLPRLAPKDAWFLYDPDGYYLMD